MFTTLSYSNNIDSLNVNESETERIIDKYGGKIVEGFNSFVETATPYAKEGFEVVLKLQIAKGIGYLMPMLFFFIFLFLFTKEYKRIMTILESDKVPVHMDRKYGAFDSGNASFVLYFYLAATIFSFLLGAGCLFPGITHLIAPEWFAIKEIIELIK